MKPVIALLVPFFALAVANPIVDATARQACDGRITLLCTEPGEGELCTEMPFQCSGPGVSPVSSDPTCVADCVCRCFDT
ncbi:hypothetical protein FB451DRAFT_1260976 [Mycena latifolia]|nr:hypothetical protein FB451DRAFT_1260976 [Mycena latifolia]